MPLCVVITRDVEARYRGFLGSIMLELAPGSYAHPKMGRQVRERVWSVVEDWHAQLARGSILMTWTDRQAAGGLSVLTLGTPPKEVVEYEGILLVRRALSSVTGAGSVEV